MFGFGGWELLLLLAIILLLFGKRIPGAMRSLGEGLREFKRGVQSSENDQDLVNSP